MTEHKIGDLICLKEYVIVKEMHPPDRLGNRERISVEGVLDGRKFEIIGQDLYENCANADFFSKEKKISKTELAEKFSSAFGKPFTVTFVKADGKDRKLRGILLEHERLFGRSYVRDLDCAEENKTRLVDHRTIKSLIIDGVNYTCP